MATGESKPLVDETELRISSSTGQGVASSNLVDVAVRFLGNSDIRKASLAKKREFLRKRGLNESQIAEALYRSSSADGQPTSSSPVAGLGNAPTGVDSTGRPWMAYSVLLGMLTLAGAGLFHVYEMYVQPYLEQRQQEDTRLQQVETAVETAHTTLTSTVDSLRTNISAIQDSIRKIEVDVATMKGSSAQSSSRDDGIAGVRAEIQTVKSLLLSRNQFASTPVQRPAIPAWQQRTSASASVGSSAPTATSAIAASSSSPPSSSELANGNGVHTSLPSSASASSSSLSKSPPPLAGEAQEEVQQHSADLARQDPVSLKTSASPATRASPQTRPKTNGNSTATEADGDSTVPPDGNG